MEANSIISPGKRPIAAVFAFVSFIYLLPSGIIMHFSSQNRDAFMHHFTMSIHWMASVIFCISIVVHLILNWKALKSYMISKVKSFSSLRKEFIIAILLSSLLIFLFSSHAFHVN